MNIFKPNDWVPVYTERGDWEIYSTDQYTDTHTENCYAEIEYSASRKRYRIKTGGTLPKAHAMYKTVVDKLKDIIYAQENKIPYKI